MKSHLLSVLIWIVWISTVDISARLTTCPDTWTAYQGSCYLFGTETPMSFFEAEHFCRQHGGHLVHVDNADENAFIKSRIRNCKSESYWMGLTDGTVEGIWQWYDTNTKPNFTDWGPAQPNDYHHHEDCAHFYSGPNFDFKWNDYACNSATSEPLCEISEREADLIG